MLHEVDAGESVETGQVEGIPEELLDARVLVRRGVDDFGISVREYVAHVSSISSDCSWDTDWWSERKYTLSCQFEKRIDFVFQWTDGSAGALLKTYTGVLKTETNAMLLSRFLFSVRSKSDA